jgi:hypothetical protein
MPRITRTAKAEDIFSVIESRFGLHALILALFFISLSSLLSFASHTRGVIYSEAEQVLDS